MDEMWFSENMCNIRKETESNKQMAYNVLTLAFSCDTAHISEMFLYYVNVASIIWIMCLRKYFASYAKSFTDDF